MNKEIEKIEKMSNKLLSLKNSIIQYEKINEVIDHFPISVDIIKNESITIEYEIDILDFETKSIELNYNEFKKILLETIQKCVKEKHANLENKINKMKEIINQFDEISK